MDERGVEIFREVIKSFVPETEIDSYVERYMESKKFWDEAMKPLFDAVRDSERITAKDLSVMVY